MKRDPGEASAIKEKSIAALENQVSEARKRMDASQAGVNEFRAKFPNLPLEESPSDMKTNSYEDRLKALNADGLHEAATLLKSTREAVADTTLMKSLWKMMSRKWVFIFTYREEHRFLFTQKETISQQLIPF